MLILHKFCTNSWILRKFLNSAQILEFCANSVQILEFSNSRIFHPTGFHDRISSNFLIISFTISGLEILGGKIPDQKVTEKCRKNCTEWQNFCQCSQAISEVHAVFLTPYKWILGLVLGGIFSSFWSRCGRYSYGILGKIKSFLLLFSEFFSKIEKSLLKSTKNVQFPPSSLEFVRYFLEKKVCWALFFSKFGLDIKIVRYWVGGINHTACTSLLIDVLGFPVRIDRWWIVFDALWNPEVRPFPGKY